MEKYKYEPLDLSGAAIRLLRLHKGSGGKISCDLFHTTRDNANSYEALSYTWGSVQTVKTVTVNGKNLDITKNLFVALGYLRQKDRDRTLWVDAICIDQSDHKERGHQVQQMGGIYKQADSVIFWLGIADYHVNVFMKSMQLLQDTSTAPECKTWKKQDDRWQGLWQKLQPILRALHGTSWTAQRRGLQTILHRPWFRRVWILQEVAHARTALVCCGKRSFSAHLFGLAPLLLWVTPDSHCQAVLDIMPGAWRQSSWWGQNRDLYTLLLHFGDSEASEPRDLIYALRAISADTRDLDILQPDYNKTEEMLVYDVLSFLHYRVDNTLKVRQRPKSVRQLVATLRTLNPISCVTLASVSKKSNMKMLLNRTEIKVNLQLLKTAVRHDASGELTKLLLHRQRDELRLDREIFIAAVKNPTAAVSLTKTLLANQKNFLNFTSVVENAALHARDAVRLIQLLLRCRENDIIITETLLLNAINNYGIEKPWLDFICARRTNPFVFSELHIEAALRRRPTYPEIVKLFTRHHSKELKVTKRLIIAATGHRKLGITTLSLLLLGLEASDSKVTETELVTFIRWSDISVIGLFLKIRLGPLRFTAKAVLAAVGNRRGQDVLAEIVSRRSRDIEFEEDAALEMMNHFGNLIEYSTIIFQPNRSINTTLVPRDSVPNSTLPPSSNLSNNDVAGGHLDTIYLFLARRQDVINAAPTSICRALLQPAAKNNQCHVSSLLFSPKENIEPSFCWDIESEASIGRALFEHEADIKTVRNEGKTPLIRTHAGRELGIVQVLAANNAETSNLPIRRPLIIEKGVWEACNVLRVMLQYDADDWNSALRVMGDTQCCNHNSAPTWDAIIEAEGEEGKTPLIMATEKKGH
ncbi:Heterokaryon incompatibility 6-like protein [Cladobotryum mycophilum]|uniref:Heterokaryon incompatibility 6-like protein n=1 Tax=Cladobotryum mycophilum TaxID=491253 RepID=A0ABR0SWK7_9HYPO